MFKNLRSNWRELLGLVVLLGMLFSGILALGQRVVSESGALSALTSLVVSLLGGAAKFSAVLAMAWLAAPLTFPKAGTFLLSSHFDSWWQHRTDHQKAVTTLVTVAVLMLVAAICVASS